MSCNFILKIYAFLVLVLRISTQWNYNVLLQNITSLLWWLVVFRDKAPIKYSFQYFIGYFHPYFKSTGFMGPVLSSSDKNDLFYFWVGRNITYFFKNPTWKGLCSCHLLSPVHSRGCSCGAACRRPGEGDSWGPQLLSGNEQPGQLCSADTTVCHRS